MKKQSILLLATSLLAGSMSSAWTAETTPPPARPATVVPAVVREADPPPATPRRTAGYPFRGRLGAIDAEKLTLTVTTTNSKRVFPVNKDTKYVKDGKPAKLTDGVVGEEVAGYVRNVEDGKVLVTSVRFGPVPKPAETAAQGSSGSPAPAGSEIRQP